MNTIFENALRTKGPCLGLPCAVSRRFWLEARLVEDDEDPTYYWWSNDYNRRGFNDTMCSDPGLYYGTYLLGFTESQTNEHTVFVRNEPPCCECRGLTRKELVFTARHWDKEENESLERAAILYMRDWEARARTFVHTTSTGLWDRVKRIELSVVDPDYWQRLGLPISNKIYSVITKENSIDNPSIFW